MVKRTLIVTGFILLFWPSIHTVFADMGRILTFDVSVSETSQKAFIFHNFDEEVLILGTDLVSAQDTTIVRFIPFPSEPKVSLAKGDPLKAAFGLIRKHNLRFLSRTKTMGGGSNAVPVEVRFHAQLGVHDVTVVRINQIGQFGKWVHSFLEVKGLSPGEDYQAVEAVASDYVKRGINHFVFDLVEVSPELHFVRPLVYRFKSKKLYYPLKTSNTFGGKGGIDLIIIAPGTLCDPENEAALYREGKNPHTIYPCLDPLGDSLTFQVSTSDEISKNEARSIYNLAEDFFHESDRIFMQLVRYWGEYDFEDDIFIDISLAPKRAAHLPEFDLGSPFSDLRKDLPKYFPDPEKSAFLASSKKQADEVLLLKKRCLKATLAAIEMEIEHYKLKLKAAKEGPGDPANVPFLQKRIRQLRVEQQKLESTNPARFKLPEKRKVKVRPTYQYKQGALLEVKGMSRSGPLYHLAGITGNNYRVLKPGKTYSLTIYLVYPRDYPFPSYYVYVGRFE